MGEDQEGAARKMARDLLGPGATSNGFLAELRRWFTRSIMIERAKAGSFAEVDECDECGARILCDACVSDMVEDECMPRARVSPTAFRVHRDYEWCARDETFFLIDVVEVGTRDSLRKGLRHWVQFGSDIDCTDEAFLRLRLFDERFTLIAEYDEEDLFEIDIAPGIGFQPANDRL